VYDTTLRHKEFDSYTTPSQQPHNNHTTTPHMRVGPSVWGPPLCEGLLCDCCDGVVNLTFSKAQWSGVHVCGLHSIVPLCCVIVV
jgi:hypothetical protein